LRMFIGCRQRVPGRQLASQEPQRARTIRVVENKHCDCKALPDEFA
jgi:hypothetical protein